jgi:hypothetical protein
VRQRLRIIVLGLLAFGIALVVVFPASWLKGALPPQINCATLAGSVWRGQCIALTLTLPGAPPFRLDSFTWKLHPLSLLRGHVQADVDLAGTELAAHANLTWRAGGRIRVANLSGVGTLDHARLTALPVGWSASAEAQDLTFEVASEKLATLSGVLVARQLRDARGTGFGDYRLEFPAPSAPPFRGALTDQGGPLQLQAQLLLNADQSWQLHGTVVLRPDSPPGLASALDQIATADINGRRTFTVEGVAR